MYVKLRLALCLGAALLVAGSAASISACIMDRCVAAPRSTTIRSYDSENCDQHCSALGMNEYFARASEWVPRGDLMIAAPRVVADGVWLRKSPFHDNDSDNDAVFLSSAGKLAKMQRKWHPKDGARDDNAMHVLEYPHPDSGPGCNPTPPPTAPTPAPPSHCQENYCAGVSAQYPVQAGVDVNYTSTYTVPAIPETFDPDSMTFYLYYNLVMDHAADRIGKYNQFVPQLTLGGSFCNGTGPPEYLPSASSLNPLKTWYIH
jgi:hypothetical protein